MGEIVIYEKRSEYDMDCCCLKCGKVWQWDTRTLKNDDGSVDFNIVYDTKPRDITGAE
jgi:hypothetical protein